MRRTRERHQPFDNIKRDLIEYWVKLLNLYNVKWTLSDDIKGLGEGECKATLTTTTGRIVEGEFNYVISRHAEMDAIFKENLQTKCDSIKSIEITSPPCPCCAVVLGVLGLSEKVISRKGHQKRAASYNMSRSDFNEVFNLLIPKELQSEAHYWFDNVYKLFASGDWYDIKFSL